MTREEILKLEPGPELDRLMAEKVMGWKRTTKGAPPGCAYWKDDDGLVRANETPGGSLDWNPSTDIAAAWEVVKYMAQRQFDFILSGHGEKYIVQVWNADPGANRVRNPLATVYGPVPLAICQAALLAVMEADNEEKGDG